MTAPSIDRYGLTAGVVLAMLTELSLEGVVTNLPSERYQRLIRSQPASSGYLTDPTR